MCEPFSGPAIPYTGRTQQWRDAIGGGVRSKGESKDLRVETCGAIDVRDHQLEAARGHERACGVRLRSLAARLHQLKEEPVRILQQRYTGAVVQRDGRTPSTEDSRRLFEAGEDGVHVTDRDNQVRGTRVVKASADRAALDVLVLDDLDTERRFRNGHAGEQCLRTKGVRDPHRGIPRKQPRGAVDLEAEHVAVELDGPVEVRHDVTEVADAGDDSCGRLLSRGDGGHAGDHEHADGGPS